MTRVSDDGGRRVSYYTSGGTLYLIEDYNADGTLLLYQQYTYREVRVPIERKE